MTIKGKAIISGIIGGALVFSILPDANAALFGRRVCSVGSRRIASTTRQYSIPTTCYSRGYAGAFGATSCPSPCSSVATGGECYGEMDATTASPCESVRVFEERDACTPCGSATEDATIYQDSSPSCYGGSCSTTSERVEYLPTPQGNIKVDSQPCPLRDAARSLASIPRNVAQRVSAAVMLAQVNAVRARYGRRALTLDASLQSAAQEHCHNEARVGRIYHAPNCGYEITAQNWDAEGVETALNQWLTSSVGHRDLLLHAGFTRCGVAYYRASDGRNYCTMRFL